MSDAVLNKVIDETVEQLSHRSLGKNGLIRKIYLLDKKRWYELYKPDDFGDHVPFVCIAQNRSDFAKHQLRLWQKRYFEGFPFPKHVFPLLPFHELSNVDDFLQGLSVLYVYFKDELFLEEGNNMSKSILNVFQTKSNMLASVSLPFIHIPLPQGLSPMKPNPKRILFYNSATNGIVCEKILDFGTWTKNRQMVKKARQCMDAWLDTSLFKKYGFFPDNYFPYESQKCLIAKYTTSPAYALLKSAQIQGGQKHKIQLLKLIDRINAQLYHNGGIANHIVPSTKKIGPISIISTNAYCRLVIETSIIFNDKVLWKRAEDIAYKILESAFNRKDSFWLGQMYEDDAVGDFANLILMLDKQRKHKKTLSKLFNYLIDRFYLGDGLWKDYSPANMQQTAHSKYLGGVLKYLVLYRAYIDGEDLLSKKWCYATQDR